MKLSHVLGARILVKPLDLVKKKEGAIELPSTGQFATSSPFYSAKVLQMGEGTKDVKHKIVEGMVILLVKGGALEFQDGTRLISLEDVMGIVDHESIPKPE